MTIRYGIVGCGSISRFHLAALEKIGADIVHIADVDAEKGEALARRCGARFSHDWRSLLEDPEVTAVSVLTPSALHLDICLEAIAAGKDILCEKTLANGAEDACTIASAALKSGSLFMTGFMKRFFPAAVKAKELMPSLGILFSAQARSYQPWGDLFSTSDSGPYEWII
ncbi:MAG: Gfo/Idh/MocA family oxidoreductase, partial [Armatimonadetes bacterium]|nr:Gfo/Idh/MocA family oxidoreductase [Armatimonadota bacterium]